MFTVNLFTYWRVKLCEKIFHFICTLSSDYYRYGIFDFQAMINPIVDIAIQKSKL